MNLAAIPDGKKQIIALSDYSEKFNKWLQKTGEAPAFIDSITVKDSKKRILQYYKNLGYYDVSVKTETQQISDKKILLKYLINPKSRYLIDSISSSIESSDLKNIYSKNKKNQKIKEGAPFEIEKFEEERERLFLLFRNNGVSAQINNSYLCHNLLVIYVEFLHFWFDAHCLIKIYLQRTKQISINPLAKHQALKTSKQVQVPFSEKEIKDVLSLKDKVEDFESVRNKLIVELFYSTGIRRSELIHIKIAAIDFNNETVKVLGKRNKERYIPLIKTVQVSLINYLKFRNEIKTEQPYLFITKKGKIIYDTLVYRIINNYFSTVSSKVKKSPHIIRHSFATHLLNEGADLNAVKELLGHSSLASTQVYTHSSLGKLKKVYNQAHPRSQKK